MAMSKKIGRISCSKKPGSNRNVRNTAARRRQPCRASWNASDRTLRSIIGGSRAHVARHAPERVDEVRTTPAVLRLLDGGEVGALVGQSDTQGPALDCDPRRGSVSALHDGGVDRNE